MKKLTIICLANFIRTHSSQSMELMMTGRWADADWAGQ